MLTLGPSAVKWSDEVKNVLIVNVEKQMHVCFTEKKLNKKEICQNARVVLNGRLSVIFLF